MIIEKKNLFTTFLSGLLYHRGQMQLIGTMMQSSFVWSKIDRFVTQVSVCQSFFEKEFCLGCGAFPLCNLKILISSIFVYILDSKTLTIEYIECA